MTANQLKKFLKDNSMSQSEAARLLDMTDRMFRRYIAEESRIPRTVEYALRWVVALENGK